MKTRNTLLQISRPFHEDGPGYVASFKCLDCKSTFCRPVEEGRQLWFFCPVCGLDVYDKLQDIEDRKYRDVGKYHTAQGWVRDTRPTFTFVEEYYDMFDEPEGWKVADASDGYLSPHHHVVNRYVFLRKGKTWTPRRMRIAPSKPLPLP